MRKLRTDLKRLADGTKMQLGKLLYSGSAKQKKSFENVMGKLDAFNTKPFYTPDEYFSLIDSIIVLLNELDDEATKKPIFAFYKNQLELFLVQVYYQMLKYGDVKRIPDYDLSDQQIVEGLDRIYKTFLKKFGEKDPHKLNGFRKCLEQSRLRSVVDFLVKVQEQRGIEGLQELHTYLTALKEELEGEKNEKI